MGSLGYTPLLVWENFPDPRVANHVPIMSEVQQREFAKMALRDVPGAKDAFHQHFGGTYLQNGKGVTPIPDTGLPWTLGHGIETLR